MKMKRLAALLMSCVLLLGLLSGCGDSQQEPQSIITYVADYHKLEGDIQRVGTACSDGTSVYFIGYIPGGKEHYMDNFTGEMVEYESDQAALFRVNLDGTGLEQLTGYVASEIPADRMGDVQVNNMMIGPDGTLWVVEAVNTYYYDVPEGFDSSSGDIWQYYTQDLNSTMVHKLNPDGSRAETVDLTALAKQVEGSGSDVQDYYIYNCCQDKDGNLYFYYSGSQSTLVVADPSGKLLFSIPEDNISGNMVRLNDGRVAVMCYGENMEMRTVDVQGMGWGDSVTTPADYNNFYNGSADYLYYYSTSSSVMGCKEDGTIEKLFTWLNCDLNQDELQGVTVNSVEQVIAVRNDWSGDAPSNELVVLNRTEIAPENQRQTLKLAVMWLGYDLRNDILDFNRNNPDCRIEVQDYSEFNTPDDYQAGMTKLTTEIISGKMPDILAVDGLPLKQYGAKGLLEDLLPYLDADTELGGREALVQPVLNAMLQDGKLYQVASNFGVNTATTSKRLAGDVTGWTLSEARAALEQLPEGATLMDAYTTRETLLRVLCNWNLGSYVNWETGECSFDTGEFAKLLEFAMLAPKEINIDDDNWQAYEERTRIREGMQLMSVSSFYDWYSILDQKANWGDDLIYVGMPSEDRNGNSFSLDSGLAMSSKCANKDAAWKFLRGRLTGDTSYRWSFPINQSAFDAFMKEAMTPDTYTDENGNVVEYPKLEYTDATGETVQIMAMTQEDYDQFMELLQSTTKLADYDEAIMNIVMDEAQAFLDGNRSADDVAKAVQSKVKFHVNEQR